MDPILPFKASLRDGTPVTIREIGPGDRALLREGFVELSAESRYMRFLAPHPRLSEDELASFTAPNSVDHFAIGALAGATPLATARFMRLRNASRAEIALTVIDDWQGKGLGGLLMLTLIAAARSRGITTFTALVHGSNHGMRRILLREGARQVNARDREAEYELDLRTADLPRSA